MHWKRILQSSMFWISLIALLSLVVHFLTYNMLGFHRDEFLYLSLGRHLAAGYWSNPPLIGLISWVSQHIPGDRLFMTRLIPALAGAFLIVLTGLIAKELGGKLYAQIMSTLVLAFSLLILRGFSMLQPVPFDILFWTIILYLLLRYVNTERPVYILLLGVFIGLGMLNKYMVLFLVAGMALGVLLTPYRRLWVNRYTGWAALIALLIFLPNLWWQYQYHFLPVEFHMNELAKTQLVHVKRINILVDQLLMFTFGSIVWVGGFVWLLSASSAAKYRLFGYIYLVVLLIFVLLRGKDYYMAGLYPFLFAAGGVSWERMLKTSGWRTAFLVLILLLSLPFVPGGIPVFSPSKLVAYFHDIPPQTGIGALLRWEDGKLHPLPQDYADMLGWKELENIVYKACDTIPDKKRLMIYAENYGEAGAIDYCGRCHGLPETVSFSDNYLLWVPDSIPQKGDILLYVNDHLGKDVDSLFSTVDSLGSITNPLAREYGTTVYMCRNPRADFREFWASRVAALKTELGLKKNKKLTTKN